MSRVDEASSNFERLLKPEIDRLYRIAYRLTSNVADAEDLVQDVLIKVYARRDELGSIEVLAPWLARVLYNLFVDNLRRYQRKRLRVVGAGSTAAKQEGDPEDIPDQMATPELAAEQEFDIKRLSEALASLSLEHRTVVLLHDSEGYKLEEIQTITGVPVGTLKSRLHRARARLRELLADMEPFSAD